jgi:hypothetical protein
MGLSGLEGVWQRLRAGAVRSRRAFRTALGFDDTRDRGVKNLSNFLGVIEGFLRSLRLGGEDSKSLVRIADLLAEVGEGVFSDMINGVE